MGVACYGTGESARQGRILSAHNSRIQLSCTTIDKRQPTTTRGEPFVLACLQNGTCIPAGPAFTCYDGRWCIIFVVLLNGCMGRLILTCEIPAQLVSFPQPLRLEIKKKLTARSDRIKSVELHPTEVRPGTESEGSEYGEDEKQIYATKFLLMAAHVHPRPSRRPTISLQLDHLQPWVLSGLYTGNVFIWDYSSGVGIESLRPSLAFPSIVFSCFHNLPTCTCVTSGRSSLTHSIRPW